MSTNPACQVDVSSYHLTVDGTLTWVTSIVLEFTDGVAPSEMYVRYR